MTSLQYLLTVSLLNQPLRSGELTNDNQLKKLDCETNYPCPFYSKYTGKIMEDMHFDVRVGVEKVVVIELQYPGLNKIEGFIAIIHMRL